MSNNYCPLLPSANHASQLIDGNASAIPLVALDVALRAGLIGTGIYVGGGRDNVVRNAICGSLAIEVFVLGWLYLQRK